MCVSVISKEPSVQEDQHAVISSIHNQAGSEETSVLIIDKIIRISEVTCEKTDSQDIINQEKSDHVQNPVDGLDLDVVSAGGKNVLSGFTESSQVRKSVLRSDLISLFSCNKQYVVLANIFILAF